MRNKHLIYAFILLIIFILACNTVEQTPTPQTTSIQTLTNDQSKLTRVARISESAPTFTNTGIWDAVPQSCYQSMTKISVNDVSGRASLTSSATIIQEESKRVNDYEIWVYHLLIANHGRVSAADNSTLEGVVTLYPGYYQQEDLKFSQLNYHQTISDAGTPQDAGILSLFGLSKINTPNFKPLEINNIIPGIDIPKDVAYYSYDYPIVLTTPHFTISTIDNSGTAKNGRQVIIFKNINISSYVDTGSSGAAICNPQGQLVGIFTLNNPSNPDMFTADANPSNIQDQITNAINIANEKLIALGFTPQP